MAIQVRKAERRKAKLRLALIGPSGSGKTMSALKLAFGIGSRIAMIDTEHGSGDLYAHLGEYDIVQLEAPYTVPRYREAIAELGDMGYDVIIIDSLSHAWAGEGGLLDKSQALQRSGKNSFSAWGDLTPEQNRLVEEMLSSPAHIIATVRSKTEYIVEKDSNGRSSVRKVGLAPVQRDGLEFDFTLVMDVADNHYARATKDRTDLFDGWSDVISEETGRRLSQWLESGVEAPPRKTADDELLERIEKALAEAPDAEKVRKIRMHHEAQHLRDRLRNGKLARLNAAIEAAEKRTAPEPEPEPTPPTDNYEWPDTDAKEAA